MKKQLSIIAAGALLLTGCGSSAAAASTASSASTAAAADHLARIKESGKLVIGLEGDWQPFSYHDDSDQLVGFDVDVAAGIADYLGVEPSYTEEKWSGLFTGLSSGVYDIVANGVDITEERKQTYDFSDPYAYDHTVLPLQTPSVPRIWNSANPMVQRSAVLSLWRNAWQWSPMARWMRPSTQRPLFRTI